MRVLIALLMIFLATENTAAQSNSSSIYRFLEVAPTAGVSALGGNHIGYLNGDFSLMHLNPAYLGSDKGMAASGSYINFLGEANMAFTSLKLDEKDWGSLSFGIRYVGYGEFDFLDTEGNNYGSFRASDFALSGAYSRQLLSNLTAGAEISLIHSTFADVRSSGVSFAGGFLYRVPEKNFSAGISIRNLGSQISNYGENKEPLPLNISAGISKKPESFPFLVIFTFNELNDWNRELYSDETAPSFFENVMRHSVFGGEVTLGQSVTLRLGYDHYLHEMTKANENFDLAGMAFGVGINIGDLSFDISRNSYSDLGGLTRLSLKTKL
ncbi:MAG: type IX secretion system protein PorQ [Gracilimonas sp.]|nr:type IX secretion system protein PorQ [Gracilimonas sp.]